MTAPCRGAVVLRGPARAVVWDAGPAGLWLLPILRPDLRHRSDVEPVGIVDAALIGPNCVVRVGWGRWFIGGPFAPLGAVSPDLLRDLTRAWRREMVSAGWEDKWREAGHTERAVRF